MTIHWKAVEQYFTGCGAQFVFFFQFYTVCNFGQFINLGLGTWDLGLGTVRSERVTLIQVNGGQR